eukprot:6118881-Pleurochrysis_carterae.AAC.1
MTHTELLRAYRRLMVERRYVRKKLYRMRRDSPSGDASSASSQPATSKPQVVRKVRKVREGMND